MAEMVRVQSLRFHTYDGVDRPEGAVYDAEAAYVETLEATGMVRRAPDAPEAPEKAPKKKAGG